jgi:aminoglycoside phosphotransferase (APT) family kinase protein
VSDEDLVLSLLDYLRSHTACPALAYAEAPERMSGGYDATILRFSLRGAPDQLSGPLVLRLFQATVDANRAPREAAVQNALAELGFPAPRVVVTEARAEALGGSFLIMERMPGRPLGSEFEGLRIKGLRQVFDIVRQLPRARREMIRLWDEAQTRLQALPVKDFVDRIELAGIAGKTLTFDDNFASLRAAAEEFGLAGRGPAFDWLVEHRPGRSQNQVICHGDFQPLNVLADNGRLTGVIDWVKATVADPAFDYGAAIAILATVPIHVPIVLSRAMRAFMNNLARTHSRHCRTLPDSDAALRYYQVFNCLVQMVTVGRNRANGTRHGIYNSPVGVANLIQHVHLLTGIQVSLPD